MSGTKRTTRADLLALAALVFEPRVACRGCGVLGMPTDGHGGSFCPECHHGCGCERCRYPEVGVPPTAAERFLWWVGCHTQHGEAGFADRFAQANRIYAGVSDGE